MIVAGFNYKDQGHYLVCAATRPTVISLIEYCKRNNIPNFIKPPYGNFHVTILNSRKSLDNHVPITYNPPFLITPDRVRPVVLKHPVKRNRFLILRIESEKLQSRKFRLMDKYNLFEHVTPTEIHVTLSFNIENFDISNLQPITFNILLEKEELVSRIVRFKNGSSNTSKLLNYSRSRL